MSPTPREFNFDERLKSSDGYSENSRVESIILGNVTGALQVHRSHQENDRSGTDWWVECSCGRHLSVDCKVRDEDWKPRGQDDLALETWSVVEKNIVGWTRDEKKRCDYVLWLWKDTGRWCMIPFPMLCTVFRDKWTDWSARFKVSQQKTMRAQSHYHSECVFVPRNEVWREIYNRFSGKEVSLGW